MIRLINKSEVNAYPEDIDAMFRIRAKVFNDRLGWDVVVQDGKEIDRFDLDCEPLYLLSINETSKLVEGTLRLLPTIGPNMLRDVFPQVMLDGTVIESPLIWESSRFCIDPDVEHGPKRISKITSELLHGAIEVGLRSGLEHIVTVYGAGMSRVFRAARCPIDVIGGPIKIGKVTTFAGLVEMSVASRDAVAEAAGFTGSVLEGAVLPALDRHKEVSAAA